MIVNPDYAPTPFPKGAVAISNSEVDAFNTCERKWWFYFGLNKEAKNPGRSLSIGIAGHEILAIYYSALATGSPKDLAEKLAIQRLSEMYVTQEFNPEYLLVAHALLSRYFAIDRLHEFCDILAVEEDFYLPITDKYWYAMRLDLLLKVKKGKELGNIVLMDHKFTYDFKTPAMLKLNPQMPKYVPTIQYSGIPVSQAYLNQFRTRFAGHLIEKKDNLDLFKKDDTDITPTRCQSAIEQQMIVSERIIERKNLDPELQMKESVPVRNDMVCRSCPFQDPCQMMDNGINIRGTMNTMYKKRSYGYLKDDAA